MGNLPNKHNDEYIAARESELEDDGYIHSVWPCRTCGNYLMVSFFKRPSTWESDVMLITLTYVCPNCGECWHEHRSD